MGFVEDRAPFFADFGETVSVGGGAIRAIFDAAYGEAQAVAGTAPVLTCNGDDVALVAVGAAAVVRGVNYTVRGIEPDGTGITLLRLERA